MLLETFNLYVVGLIVRKQVPFYLSNTVEVHMTSVIDYQMAQIGDTPGSGSDYLLLVEMYHGTTLPPTKK